MRKIKVVIFLLFFFITTISSAQWTVVYHTESFNKIYYNLQNDSSLVFLRADFYFPEIYQIDSLKNFGYRLSYKNINRVFPNAQKEKINGWEKKFSSPINFKKDSTIIYLKFYSKYKDQITIFLQTSDKVWYKKDCNLDYSGYIVPLILNPSEFYQYSDGVSNNQEKRKFLYNDSTEMQSINKIVITKNTQNKLVFNNIIIGNRILIEKECIHPFFDNLFNKIYRSDSLLKGNLFYQNCLSNTLFCTQEYYKSELCGNYMQIKTDESSPSVKEKQMLIDIVLLAIKEYPFYSERKLNRDSILNMFNFLIKNSTDSLLLFHEELSNFIKHEFNDGHFFLDVFGNDKYKEKLVIGPIGLYSLNNKILVAAIFDSTYNFPVSLGDEVLAINNIPVQEVVDSLLNFQYGSSDRKKSRAISLMIKRGQTDSCLLQLKNSSGNIKSVIIKYKNKTIIPESFNPQHCKFIVDTNNVTYFSARRMDGTIYLRFINHYNDIIKSKGLIIDLRGNPGGSSSDGENIFSLFIDNPTIYHHVKEINQSTYETLVINSNKRFHFPPNLRIVILADENTSCASEDFIQAMQQLKNVVFIGCTKTSGALHSRYTIKFPSNSCLSIDCMSPKVYSAKYNLIECNGIEPDIWINRTKIDDLAPYNDIVLTAAKKFLNSKY